MARILLALAALVLLALPRSGMAAALPEAQVKAAFIFNFLLFTDWPASTAPPKRLRLCVVGEDAVARALHDLDGRKLGIGTVAVSGVRKPEGLRVCHALYLAASEHSRWSQWLSSPLTRSILTVTDSSERLSDNGSVLAVAVKDDRVVFSLNLELAKRQQLNFSARILQLAQRVDTP